MDLISPTGAFKLLHSFNGSDGGHPRGALLQADDGDFYGTAYEGGSAGLGTVFRVTAGGVFTNLHSFDGVKDGKNPAAALTQADDGDFYGTTTVREGTGGTVFRLTFRAIPVVSFKLAGGGNKAAVAEGGALNLAVTRTGGDLTQPLTVKYKPKGASVAGKDYKPLAGTVTIPAGAATATLTVRALDDGVADGTRILKLNLVPASDGSYTLGIPGKVKVRLLDQGDGQ